MIIQVVGCGVVGSAQAFLMKKIGHIVHTYDPPKGMLDLNPSADIAFICVMEDVVEQSIQEIVEKGFRGLLVIKSTVPVGTTRRLMEKFRRHICHNPEFLREKYAFQDVLNPGRIVIGECCREHGNLLEEAYEPFKQSTPFYRTDPTTSELIKLVTNSLRAINISFWNELYELCQRCGADINMVAEAADPGKVLGVWEGGRFGTRFFGVPYGGKCLPKDLRHLIEAFRQFGLNPVILEAAAAVNRKLGGE